MYEKLTLLEPKYNNYCFLLVIHLFIVRKLNQDVSWILCMKFMVRNTKLHESGARKLFVEML